MPVPPHPRHTPKPPRGDRPPNDPRRALPPARQKLDFTFAVAAVTPPPDFLEMAERFGIAFEPGELQRYGHFLALLLANNDLLNLTAITDPREAWIRHIFDSLTILPLLDAPDSAEAATTPSAPPGERDRAEQSDPAAAEAHADHQPIHPTANTPADDPETPAPSSVQRVCDIGSGGGAPGLVLAIARPDIQFTLVEATAKKAQFLEAAIAHLALTNCQVLNARAEEVSAHVAGQGPILRPGAPKPLGLLHRAAYDLVTARAVGRVAVIAEWAIPLLRIGGRAALVKGEKAAEELAEAKQALHLLHAHHIATIPTPTGRLVVLEKTRKTPAQYPRKTGEAKRRPLGLTGD